MRTTESSVSLIKEQTWYLGSVQSGALWLVKSEGKLTLPARCCRLNSYRFTLVKKRRHVSTSVEFANT